MLISPFYFICVSLHIVVSNTYCVVFCFVFLLLVYPMMPVSLDCPFLLSLRYSLTFICPVFCVPYVASFSGLSFFIVPSVFSNVLCLVYPMLPVSLDCPFLLSLRYSLTFICPVSCVPHVASFSEFSIFIFPSPFSNVYYQHAHTKEKQ